MADNEDEASIIQRPRTIIAAVVAVIVLGLVAWLVLGRGSDNSAASAPPISPSPTTTTSAGGGTLAGTPTPSASKPLDSNYDSACGLKGGTTSVPTDTPLGVDWQNVGGFYFPVSETAGPRARPPSGPWSCFARTPTGAVIAAYTIAVRVSVAADFKAVVTQQTVPGVGQSALLAQGQQRPGNGATTIPRGFLVDSYTNDDATVTFYLRQASSDATCSMHVQWYGGAQGDWLLRLETDGGTSSGCIQGPPSRYVRWGPTT